MEEGKKAGRPPIFETPEELEAKVTEYFHSFGIQTQDIGSKESRPTITGLCLFLGFESRQSFHDYGQKPEFSYTIKKARLRIENQYELMLSNKNPTGSIFALKNLGWKDESSVNVNDNRKATADLFPDELTDGENNKSES